MSAAKGLPKSVLYGRAVLLASLLLGSGSGGCLCDPTEYHFHQAAWSDTDERVVALMSTFPPSAITKGSTYVQSRTDIVIAPASDLTDTQVVLEVSDMGGFTLLHDMQSAGYVTMLRFDLSFVAMIVFTEEPVRVVELASPGAGCTIRDFVPSPDGALIAATAHCESDNSFRVDVYDVQAEAFVASWENADVTSNFAGSVNGLRWSAAGDLYCRTRSSILRYLRFDGGLADPVEVNEVPCYHSPATTSGLVNSTGQGLCHDAALELCELTTANGDPVQPFGCPG